MADYQSEMASVCTSRVRRLFWPALVAAVLALSIACAGGSDEPVGITAAESASVAPWPHLIRVVSRGPEGTLLEWKEPGGVDDYIESYEVYRRIGSSDLRAHITQPDEWSLVSVVRGVDGTDEYSFLDETASAGESYEYKLTPILKSD